MVSTIIIWLLVYGIASVLGTGLIHLTQRHDKTNIAQTEVVLTGLLGIVSFLQLASIGLPADYRLVLILVTLAGFVNWRLQNRPVRMAIDWLGYIGKQPVIWLLGLVIVLYATYQPTNADSGLYHLSSIRWYERFRAIPGLGNVHGRLAFNSSFFVISAAFGFTDVVGQTLLALNGFMILLFGAYSIQCINTASLKPEFKTLLLLLLGLVLYYLVRQVSSPTPDVWGAILPLFVFLLWLDDAPAPVDFRMLLLIALMFVSLTIKLATIPLLLFIPFIVYKNRRELRLTHGLTVVVLGVLIVVPWVVRNSILSGYLIYPLPALDVLSVDWKIPIASVQYEQDIVTFCARFRLFETYLDPAMMAWPLVRWVPWWLHTPEHYWLNRPLFWLALLSPLVIAGRWVVNRQQTRQFLPAYGIALAGFIFWFIKAPEFRFGYAFIWMTAVLPICFFVRRSPSLLIGKGLMIGSLGLLLAYFVGQRLIKEGFPVYKYLLVPQTASYHMKEKMGSRYEPRRTRSGLMVIIPSPVPYEQSCYEIEQLCSPYFYNDLESRGASLTDGFRRRSTQ